MLKNLVLTSLMAIFSSVMQEQTRVVRIADIEIYPQYVGEYIKMGKEIAATSMREEEGVICLFPCQMKEDSTRFRIVEIYASPEAYQHHIHTEYFLRYKQKTMKMVKSLKLNDLTPMDIDGMTNIFKRNDR